MIVLFAPYQGALRQIEKEILLICLLLPFTLPETAAFPAILPHFHALTKLSSQATKSPATFVVTGLMIGYGGRI